MPSLAVARPRVRWAVPEPLLLLTVPLLISCLLLCRALLGYGIFAPTDIVAHDPLVSAGSLYPPVAVQNPLMGDVVDSFIPWRLYARAELQAGRFPLWNPYNLLGTHLHANLQSAVFSPFNLVWLLVPPMWGLGFVALLKWTLAGWGMALFLRRLGLGLAPAIFGAVAFQLSGPLVAWFQWPIAEGLLWVPWMMWAVLGWLQTRRPIWLVALSLTVAAEWLAGHIETPFHSSVFLAAFALATWLTTAMPARSRLIVPLGLLASALIGLGIAAVQLMPFFDVLPQSYQWWLRSQVDTSGFSQSLQSALMWLTPNIFGPPTAYAGPGNWIEANPYIGALPLLLVLTHYALRITRHASRFTFHVSRFTPFWLIALLTSASMAYGVPPLSLLRELPGFSTSFNSRLISVASFCLIVLAAIALDYFLRLDLRLTARPWTWVAIAFTVAGLAFLLPALAFRLSGTSSQLWLALAGAIFCAGAALILARMLGRLGARAFATLAVLLLGFDLLLVHSGFNTTSPSYTFYPPNALLSTVAQGGPTARTAVVGEYAGSNMLNPYRMSDMRLYDATMDNRYMDFMRLLSPETRREAFRRGDAGLTTHQYLLRPNATILSLIGVHWLIAPTGDDPNSWQDVPERGPIYSPTSKAGDFTLWANSYARPYAGIAYSYEVAPDAATVFTNLRTLNMTGLSTAQVEDPAGTLPPDIATGILGSRGEGAGITRYLPGDVTLSTLSFGKRLLVINESWSPGWRATVDGNPAPLYRANYVAQALVIPSGNHTVHLVYDPPAFHLGVNISLAALAALVLLIVWSLASWIWSLVRRRRT